MCRAMKRSFDATRRPWFRSGKARGRMTSARRCPHPCVPRRPFPLRPVNVRGHSAKGMRAPENTNQFLMTEKYALHALRSDSVDSDSDPELSADLEGYLCAWEDAHGGLLDQDSPEKGERNRGDRFRMDRGHALLFMDTETEVRGEREGREGERDSVDNGLSGHSGHSKLSRQTVSSVDEDSCQYFPSEDDLKLSDNFMYRDFTEFCHIVTS